MASVTVERKVKKSGPHRVVIERGGNGVSITAHPSTYGPYEPGQQEPQPMFFSKASAAKKHTAAHIDSMMPSEGGEEAPEQGSGAPAEAL